MSFRPVLGKPRLTHDWGTEQHERETHWTSLFYDLMLVAALNAIAEPFEEFEEEEDGGEILAPIGHLWLDAALKFFSVINPWNSLNEITSMIEDESLVGHLSFFVHCFGIAATTAGCVGELSGNYKELGTGIVIAKVGLLIMWSRPMIYIERVRIHGFYRLGVNLVNICLILCGLNFEGENAFVRFRAMLILSTFWDWGSLQLNRCMGRENMVPLHIKCFSDRVKESTMVIFGEAIFAIILKPFSEASPETHYYLALSATLWLIYGLALQEFHILPSEEEHALRRSIRFGMLWYYTQLFKQFCLLGASIGIKRAHLLTFVAPLEPVDRDTRNLVVWGLSLTMLAVVMIRSYSFGYGRHPSKDDPPVMYRLKSAWWAILSAACWIPQIVERALLKNSARPLTLILAFGSMMAFIIFAEAVMSNAVADYLKKSLLASGAISEEEANELSHLISSSSRVEIHEHADEARVIPSRRPSAFLAAHAPKSK